MMMTPHVAPDHRSAENVDDASRCKAELLAESGDEERDGHELRRKPLSTATFIIRASVFAAAAALARYVLPNAETRWQIAAWVGLASASEVAFSRGSAPARLARFLVMSSAAATGAIAVRAHLEPEKMRADLSTAHHIGRAVMNCWRSSNLWW